MNGWKVAAILFMLLFVIETIGVIWIAMMGINIVNNESKCSINTCQGYDAFIYDSTSNICSCYVNNKVEKTEYLG